jgi:hypothetical protein
MAQDNQKNAQNYFEQFQNAFKANAQSCDLSKTANALQEMAKKTAESFTAAGKAVFESAQSIAKSQAEFYQKQAEQISAAANKAFSGAKPEETIESGAKLAQKSIDANLKNGQEVAKSASEAAVQAFDILNKQAVKNLNEISEIAKAS